MSMNTQYSAYPQVGQQPDYPNIEEDILEYWNANRIFDRSLNGYGDGDGDNSGDGGSGSVFSGSGSPDAQGSAVGMDGDSDGGPVDRINLHDSSPGKREEFIFYDGPPFANGLPHYGHLLTGFVKDTIPRFWTMRGKLVERRFGWDCHGLPAEMAAEKDLGVSGRVAINEYGVDRFNAHCRSLVQNTTDAWERYVHRQARWVDFENAYRTMDTSYMESVMWAFKRLYELGLVYESERVLPYCWECETPLSNFETRQDDSYRNRIDPAVTVAFTVYAKESEGSIDGSTMGAPGSHHVNNLIDGEFKLLVWTTTPWTLPSNLALAVGADIDYAAYMLDGSNSVPTLIASLRAEEYGDLIGDMEPAFIVKGSEIAGRSYKPLFDFFSDSPNSFKILTADFVATDEGTGVVHLAPGFGEDDYEVCTKAGIKVVCPMDERGRFTSEVSSYEGLQVFDANKRIIDDLSKLGARVRRESYEHSYPHCWRTDTPLVYKAVSSWFVKVTAIKDRLLAQNEAIHWVPSHIQHGAFGKWLEGARDWSISRNRFWGSPIPVWKSDDPNYPRVDVYGSIEELEADFSVHLSDLHLPEIDSLTRPNPDDPTGKSTMRRIPDVLDCWFESGSMPFAQFHYPFENAEWFESHFPSDFVVEYVAQTRGWFYTLHVLAVALFDKPAFKNCIAHGVILGSDGRKMSKRLSNYPEPEEVFNEYGADAMRWFLLSSPVLKGQDLIVQREAIKDTVRLALNPIWNAWYFLSLYANADRMKGVIDTGSSTILDRYILSKASKLVMDVTTYMEEYDLSSAYQAVSSFVEVLDNWYIRRNRDRFWMARDGSLDVERDKSEAYNTLHTVLTVLARLTAPLVPLLSERIYMDLTGETSVHLSRWPSSDELPYDPQLNEAMDRVRDICSTAHGIRKSKGIRARLPLASLTVAVKNVSDIEPYTEIIADELNVKQVVLTDDYGSLANSRLTTVPSVLGPRLGSQTQRIIKAGKEGNWQLGADGSVYVDGIKLEEGEYSLDLVPLDEENGRALPNREGIVILDTDITEDLFREGTARDIVRLIQQARRSAGLEITDRIDLQLGLSDTALKAVEENAQYISEQTQALRLTIITDGGNDVCTIWQAEGSPGLTGSPSGGNGYTESAALPDGGNIVITIKRL